MTRAEERSIHKNVKKAAENLIKKMEKASLYKYDPLPIIIYEVAEIADEYASSQSDYLISHINRPDAVQTAFIVSMYVVKRFGTKHLKS